jgi:ribulose kinase
LVEELAALYETNTSSANPPRASHDLVVAAGNAVRKNRLLREILSARLGRPVAVPAHDQEAAYGAALVAGVGVGVWPDLATAGKCIQYECVPHG